MEIQEEKDADLTGKQQDVFHVGTPTLGIEIQALIAIDVTSFSSISYYSNVRLVSKIELEQNFQSTILDVHASANERPPHLSLFQATQHKKYQFKIKGVKVLQVVKKPTSILLLNPNEHLKKKLNSCLNYFLWEFTDLENHVQDVV